VLDAQVKVFTPNADNGLEAAVAIDKMRQTFLKPKASVRLIGLSGVGKTRLVQALFDDRIVTTSETLDRHQVVYTDLSESTDPHPLAMVEALISQGDRCVLVVDNCGGELHQRLTESVRRASSQISLITVEYDIRDDLSESTGFYRLEPSSDDLIKMILERRYSTLPQPDIERIAEFASGNARVAFALADTVGQGGELSKLEDEALFRRLFNQKNVENDDLLRCAEVCSLLYSFDGIDTVGPDAELPLLSELAEVSVLTLARHISELQRRGLVQSRGKWRAVLPHAIANRLAQRALQNIPTELLIKRIVGGATDRIARSFSRRLSFLHKAPQARKIAEQWFAEGGMLSDPKSLNDLGRDIFRNAAPVPPLAALKAIQKACRDEEFLSIVNRT
jgi:hypothetical protein